MRNLLIIGTILASACATTMLAQTLGEKKLRGCVSSQKGQYFLEEKQSKKDFLLVGSREFASYIGHAVTVRGTFALASNGSGRPEPHAQFVVTSLADAGSENCTADKGKIEQASNAKPSPYRK